MKFITPSPGEVRLGLRAMRALIDSKDAGSPMEEEMLAAIQRVWGTSHDLAQITAITPDELARELPEGPLRRQLVAGLTALALYDGEAQAGEIALIGAFARALGVADGVTGTLRQYAEGHLRRMRFDLVRRSWVAKKIREEVLPDRGLWGALRTALEVAGKLGDPEVLARCRTLEGYPAGSLGRAYHDYIIANGFSFPGTRGAPPEMMIAHDCAHILSGYATDPEGEVQVLGFVIGFMDQDPADHLLSVLMQFHLGIQITPGAAPQRGFFHPETFLHAVRRGAAMNVNLNDRWDPWAVFGEGVEELRARYGVPPLGAQLD